MYPCLIKRKVLNFKKFMKKYNLKKTMNESQLQKVYKYPIYPRDSKIHSDRGFVNIDDGSQRGSHCVLFTLKITNPIILIVSVVIQILFYLNNYPNQYYIITIKFKILILNYVEAFVYTFSI